MFSSFFKYFYAWMKKYFPLLLIYLLVVSCRDKEPVIIPVENPLELHPNHYRQNVLIESLCGEWNSASIESRAQLEALRLQNLGRIFVANFHHQDWLETPYTQSLISFLGGTIGLPKAAVNRLPGSNTELQEDNQIWLSPINWNAAALRQLSQEAPLALALESGIAENANAYLNIYIAHRQAFEKDIRVQIYLVEDSIKNIFQQGALSAYHHPSVFKEILSAETGDTLLLNEAFPEGNIRQKKYEQINLSNYNLQKLRFIVMIYQYDSDFRKRQILNVQEVKFGGTKYWDL
jgi:hypothetical protein